MMPSTSSNEDFTLIPGLMPPLAGKPVTTPPKPTYTPTKIQDISGYKAHWGGKAVSLWSLMNNGFSVPMAWVIPCEACITRPNIDTSKIMSWLTYYYGSVPKFAVRSGAPISMPGLLQTRLNVAFGEIQEAVEAVWDSWHSEHAKLYRMMKGLPDDMGTAVIIQIMPRNILYAGVAFTNHPTNIDDPELFDPLIEYVEGTGDKLVGGEAQGTKAKSGDKIYNALRTSLRDAHNYWGPSDMEWVIDSDWGVYWVQQRPLKFTPAPPEVGVDDEGRELIVSGKAIGATTKVAARIVKGQYALANMKDGDAIYVREFLPEYYPLMMRASAIICGTGGETCHAAIIARELGKPAISDITTSKFAKLEGQKVFLNGHTGKIYKAKETDEAENTAAVQAVLDELRTPDLSLTNLGRTFDVNQLLYRFYKTLDNHAKGIGSTEWKDAVVREIAWLLSTYFYIATCCEMRYVRRRAAPSKSRRTCLAVLKRLGVDVPHGGDDGIPGRTKFATRIPQPASLAQAITTMDWITRGYNNPSWQGAFGGPKWGVISGMVLKYLKGELTPTMFVDACFNLKHNGGCAFDKFEWISAGKNLLTKQLDAKQSSKGIVALDQLMQSTYGSIPKAIIDEPSILPGYKHFLDEDEAHAEVAAEASAE
jgi:phosphohistidine swiveling domain-containing protein